MPDTQIHLLLADDDQDDCFLFSEALNELSSNFKLEIVHDGVELMNFLSTQKTDNLPNTIFLDLNMPRKNGYECLIEIRQNHKFNPIKIIIFSTSFDLHTAHKLREIGADYYIRKPSDFSVLKKALNDVISIIQSEECSQANKDNFILLS
jgi:CheY-like chemotaxis protein